MSDTSSRSSSGRTRNIWRDGLWIGAVAFVIVTIGAFYQLWIHFGPEGAKQRAELKGNGVDVPSYGFDLSKLAEGVNPNEIRATALRRNEVPVMKNPGHITVAQNKELKGYEKYVLPTDRVVGVVNGGFARAYPIQVMQVHQIANDALGNQLIVVYYDPLADTANAWVALKQGDTQQTTASENPFLRFGVSGLEYKGLSLAYDYDGESESGASLWDLARGLALAGPLSGASIQRGSIQCNVMQWRDWIKLHPDTSILQRDDNFKEQYKEDRYGPYYLSNKLPFPIVPVPPSARLAQFGLGLKSRGVGVEAGITGSHSPVFFPYESILANSSFDEDGLGTMSIELWGIELVFHCREADKGFTPSTAWMETNTKPNNMVQATPMCMLFAWFATNPETYVLERKGGLYELVKP